MWTLRNKSFTMFVVSNHTMPADFLFFPNEICSNAFFYKNLDVLA